MLPNILVQLFLTVGFIFFLFDIAFINIYKYVGQRKEEVNTSDENQEDQITIKKIIAVTGIFGLVIFFILIFLLVLGYDSVNPRLREIQLGFGSDPVRIIGFSTVVIGDLVLFTAYLEIGTNWSFPLEDLDGRKQIIKTGLYSISRHPIYQSLNIITLGFVLLSLNWALVALFFISAFGFYFQSLIEEEVLISHYGDEYRDYMEKTARYLPKSFLLLIFGAIAISIVAILAYIYFSGGIVPF